MTLSISLLVGISSTHLVKKSVVVKIHLCFPLEGGLISPTKSKPTVEMEYYLQWVLKESIEYFAYWKTFDIVDKILPEYRHM